MFMMPTTMPIVTENAFMRKIGCRRILGLDKNKSRTRSGTRAAAHTVPMMSNLRHGVTRAMYVNPGGGGGMPAMVLAV